MALAFPALSGCAPHRAGDASREPQAAPISASIIEKAAIDPATPAPAPSSPVAAIPARPTPIGGVEMISLVVPQYESAVVSIPTQSSDRRPIVVATHGNFDRPDWQCDVWSRVFRHRVFVVCPKGNASQGSSIDDTRFTYQENHLLEKEIDADLKALRGSAFAPYVDDGPPVYVGFSLGAIMGAVVGMRRPADFPSLILVEGGLDQFDDDRMQGFVKNGGKRVMFVCAQIGCAGPATAIQKRFVDLGIESVVVDAGQVGHSYDGKVADAVAAALPAFLASEERFASVFAEEIPSIDPQ